MKFKNERFRYSRTGEFPILNFHRIKSPETQQYGFRAPRIGLGKNRYSQRGYAGRLRWFRMMYMHEGWQFKLQFVDFSEEVGE